MKRDWSGYKEELTKRGEILISPQEYGRKELSMGNGWGGMRLKVSYAKSLRVGYRLVFGQTFLTTNLS